MKTMTQLWREQNSAGPDELPPWTHPDMRAAIEERKRRGSEQPGDPTDTDGIAPSHGEEETDAEG